MPNDEAYIFDSSAVIALIGKERGCEEIEDLVDGAFISAVNIAEVVSSLSQRGLESEAVAKSLGALGLQVIPLDAPLAYRVGALRALTRSLGLSLGDRACLATAESLNATALTADRVWKKLDLGVDIRVIR